MNFTDGKKTLLWSTIVSDDDEFRLLLDISELEYNRSKYFYVRIGRAVLGRDGFWGLPEYVEYKLEEYLQLVPLYGTDYDDRKDYEFRKGLRMIAFNPLRREFMAAVYKPGVEMAQYCFGLQITEEEMETLKTIDVELLLSLTPIVFDEL